MVSADLLKKVELFEALDEFRLSVILSHSRVESCPEGRIIFREGEDATYLYVLIEGAIDFSVRAQKKVAVMSSQVTREGSIFGIPSLLEPYRYNVTAICSVPSRILRVEADYLRTRMDEEPRLGMKIMKKLALIYFNRLNELRAGVVDFFETFPPQAP
jgi:CRP/FNR family transcriptional regulator, cyclic AMP receptor protein